MKQLVLLNTVLFLLSVCTGEAQGNRVFSGGEVMNCSIVNISARNGVAWSTDRSKLPGYFSVISTATYIGCSDDANIDGYVKKYGNNPFIFPVGSGNDLRTLEISAPTSITDAYATAWIVGDPSLSLDPTGPNAGPHSVLSVSAPIVAVSNEGQWDWQIGEAGNLGKGTTGTGVGLTITVSMPEMTTFSHHHLLRLVGWNGKSWIDLSGKSTANGNAENSSLSGTMQPGITAIAIGRIESPYAVKLESFNATSSNCYTVLKWNTSNEVNTESFIVEQSFDAVNFYPLSSVKASGSIYGSIYKMTIAQPPGDAFYRLKMMYFDSTFAYSYIIVFHNNCYVSDYMVLYPNPVSEFENINLSFTTNYKGNADLIVFNVIGQKNLIKPITVTTGSNLITTAVKSLSPGTYFMVLLNEDGKQIGTRQKFIRQ